MNPYGYQPNAVYTSPCCPQNTTRGASWIAIALVIFLLLIINVSSILIYNSIF